MFETKDLRNQEMMENGEGHKIKWGEYFHEFTGLDFERMVRALASLPFARLESLIDAAESAKDKSKQKTLEAACIYLIQNNVDIPELVEYHRQRKEKQAQPAKRITKEMKKSILTIITEGLKASKNTKAIKDDVSQAGFDINANQWNNLRGQASKAYRESLN